MRASHTLLIAKLAARSMRVGRMARAAVAALLVAPLLLPSAATAADISLRRGYDNVSVVDISGEIEKGDGQRVERFIKRLPSTKPVIVNLDSQGGYIVDALQMGRVFHANMVRTQVVGRNARCVSACALAFLGGRDSVSGRSYRVKGTEARLVFHSFRREVANKDFTVKDMKKAVADTQNMILLIAEYMSEIGADLELMAATLSPPNAQAAVISNQKALEVGIHVWENETRRLRQARGSLRHYARAN